MIFYKALTNRIIESNIYIEFKYEVNELYLQKTL